MTVQEKIITPVRQIHLFVYMSVHAVLITVSATYEKKGAWANKFLKMDVWGLLDNGLNNRYSMVLAPSCY